MTIHYQNDPTSKLTACGISQVEKMVTREIGIVSCQNCKRHIQRQHRLLAIAYDRLQRARVGEDNAKSNIELRPAVCWFAEQMELKLRANDHKGGWSRCSLNYLFSRLKEEVVELDKASDFHIDFDAVISEAADVANFAMMIADNVHRARMGGEG